MEDVNVVAPIEGQAMPTSSTVLIESGPKVAKGIDKDSIIDEYSTHCQQLGFINSVTTKKGEPTTTSSSSSYPPYHRLVAESSIMKPSIMLQYRVDDLTFDNIVIHLTRNQFEWLDKDDIKSLASLNSLYQQMISDVIRLDGYNFHELKAHCIGYENQTSISQHRVDMATAAMIHYGLHPGMLVRFLGGEFVGQSRNVRRILDEITPHVSAVDVEHVKRILTQGCPSYLNFMEPSNNKLNVIRRGNSNTFETNQPLVEKTMNKEERNSHIIPMRKWVVYFSPYTRHTPQSIIIKQGKKDRVVWDGSTKYQPLDIVMNDITPTDLEAEITFGEAKMQLLVSIYNWRISFPLAIIYLAWADITACFRFPRVAADLTGAFGFLALQLYFLAIGMVFGSNTSPTSWEPLRRSIQALIPIYYNTPGLVEKHEKYLRRLKWRDIDTSKPKTVAKACPINTGMLHADGSMKDPEAPVYVDDILMAIVGKENMLRLLAAAIEAIFLICGEPETDIRQCPLSLEKWDELTIGTEQVMLGLLINTDKMTVGITEEYKDQIRELLHAWGPKRKHFKVHEIQKLVGKLARLGEGAPWIYKIMSHLYTSLAVALKSNKQLLEASSPEFRLLILQIERKQFTGSQTDIAKQLNFAENSSEAYQPTPSLLLY